MSTVVRAEAFRPLDAMERPAGLTGSNNTWASGVAYPPANQANLGGRTGGGPAVIWRGRVQGSALAVRSIARRRRANSGSARHLHLLNLQLRRVGPQVAKAHSDRGRH